MTLSPRQAGRKSRTCFCCRKRCRLNFCPRSICLRLICPCLKYNRRNPPWLLPRCIRSFCWFPRRFFLSVLRCRTKVLYKTCRLFLPADRKFLRVLREVLCRFSFFRARIYIFLRQYFYVSPGERIYPRSMLFLYSLGVIVVIRLNVLVKCGSESNLRRFAISEKLLFSRISFLLSSILSSR